LEELQTGVVLENSRANLRQRAASRALFRNATATAEEIIIVL
jgi:hypothetical protein